MSTASPATRHATPELKNAPANILNAWIGLEVLSPATFGYPEDLASDQGSIVSLDRPRLPWEGQGEKSKPNFQLFYHVVLGSINLDQATKTLLEKYSDSRAEMPKARGRAVIAVITVDRKGRPVSSPAVSLSSFAWGVPVALQEDLANLADWPNVEFKLVDSFDRLVREVDENGEILPLRRETIDTAYRSITSALHLPDSLVEPPFFIIRVYQYYKNPEPPQLLLNSFFLRDLATAKQLSKDGNLPSNLIKYLAAEPPTNRFDLLKDHVALEEAVAPCRFPPARWPGPGRHPLVLLQQTAVNLSLAMPKEGGIIAVNGPPGTGKTTLLRDLVAAIVTARAEAMTNWDDPESAFTASGEKIQAGAGWLDLYKLDARLKGFEMLVASSNNKAVENVSAELPAVSAISDDIEGLNYFKTISDELLKPDRETWALIAAVLGKAANRSHFKQVFWWHEDVGMMTYLAEATGKPQVFEVKDGDGKVIETRKPKVVAQNDPPSGHQAAVRRWKQAKSEFLTALKKTRETLSRLELVRNLTRMLPAVEQAEVTIREFQLALLQHQKCAPSFLVCLLPTHRNRKWRREKKRIIALLNDAKKQHDEAFRVCFPDRYGQGQVHATGHTHIDSESYKATIKVARQQIEEARIQLGTHLIDAQFFERDHADFHRCSPWCDSGTQVLRDELFIAALKLHKAFIDAAAKPLKHNVGVLMGAFGGSTLPDEKAKLLGDLWSSLFIIVPIVSTTFASVERMLGAIPPNSFEWLFVDEAGQALPQAAVGAIFRCRRVVVVGDPIQLEPIVTLPDSLTEQICRSLAIDPDRFNAPAASVQTLADAATPYYGTFEGKRGARTVGVPLLVHRRCSEPMFSISNSVAYERLMVSAKPTKPSRIRDLLGPSKWIDIVSPGFDKWSDSEGRALVELLKPLSTANFVPDIYIITPFVIVADKVREIMLSSGMLKNWTKSPEEWVFERVGTVHTVQGREAEAVIFLLGAPDPLQAGARNWAGARPNLLNVAVTRAKEAIYVIGNRTLWRSAGLFNTLHAHLP
jgi:AAA domain